jgi:hypothetical protein
MQGIIEESSDLGWLISLDSTPTPRAVDPGANIGPYKDFSL